MTILKVADDKQPAVDALTSLLQRPDLTAAQRKDIDTERRIVLAGIQGEKDAAYDIDFEYRDRRSYVVIHDLRIEFNGRVAQIDHLLLNRIMDMWVCETKSFKEGVKINEHGEWYRYGGGRAYGMASPVSQNRHHVAVLQDLFSKGAIRLPKRIVTIKPRLMPVVLVSNHARIDRPAMKYRPSIDGLETVIKVESLEKTIDKAFDERNAVVFLGKVVSPETIQDIGQQLVALHRPASIDYERKFGLVPVTTPKAAVAEKPLIAPGSTSTDCETCGRPLSAKVAAYAREHEAEFGGNLLCFECQQLRRRAARRRARAPQVQR